MFLLKEFFLERSTLLYRFATQSHHDLDEVAIFNLFWTMNVKHSKYNPNTPRKSRSQGPPMMSSRALKIILSVAKEEEVTNGCMSNTSKEEPITSLKHGCFGFVPAILFRPRLEYQRAASFTNLIPRTRWLTLPPSWKKLLDVVQKRPETVIEAE